MAEESYEPDWNSWPLVSEVTVEAAVALSLNVDPRRLLAWKMLKARTQSAEIREFEDRIYFVKQWGLRGRNWVRENYEGGTPTIYLRQFAQYAKRAGWQLPEPLLRLAGAGAGDGANVDEEVPVEKNDTRANQTAVRPQGISDEAWDRFCRAIELDPAFNEKFGGISKAARRIAGKDTSKIASIRRDLHRVLDARGPAAQK